MDFPRTLLDVLADSEGNASSSNVECVEKWNDDVEAFFLGAPQLDEASVDDSVSVFSNVFHSATSSPLYGTEKRHGLAGFSFL